MKRLQISEAEYEAIKAKEASVKDKKIKKRLRILMMWYEGQSLKAIGEKMGVHLQSVYAMCRRYREYGLEKYAHNQYASHYRLLSDEKEKEILDQFKGRGNKQVTAKEIKEALDKACGKNTGSWYVYRVLKRHGWKKKMLNSQHQKAANGKTKKPS